MTEPWFSAADGVAMRDAAVLRLAASKYVIEGQRVAAEVAFTRGTVTADDVRAELGDPPSQGPMGAVFLAGGYFYRVRNTHTVVVKGHARVIGQWALTAAGRKAFGHLNPHG